MNPTWKLQVSLKFSDESSPLWATHTTHLKACPSGNHGAQVPKLQNIKFESIYKRIKSYMGTWTMVTPSEEDDVLWERQALQIV